MFKCEQCAIDFIPPYKNYHTPQYCSHKCRGLAIRKPRYRECEVCHKDFLVGINYITKIKVPYKQRFCSMACSAIYRSIKKSIRKCLTCDNEFSCLPKLKKYYCSRVCVPHVFNARGYFSTRRENKDGLR